MSFNFEAEPKVIESKSKFRHSRNDISHISNQSSENHGLPNLMMDPRIRHLQPAQQEEEYIRLAKENITLDNMHNQLLTFKKNKKKVSPYDIRPSGNPRIDVNLNFFLTDSTNIKPPQSNSDCQTDKFQEKPVSPKYTPKKTGRDVYTQVQDNELFSFDREVQPIIEVVVTKTLEQAVIEIEEEEEIAKIQNFKQEFIRRRQQDEKAWKEILQKEVDKITKKNKVLEKYNERARYQSIVIQKVQAFNIAQNYMRNIKFNTFSFLYNKNITNEEIKGEIPKIIIQRMQSNMITNENILLEINNLFTHLPKYLTSIRASYDEKFNKSKEKRRIKRINYSKENRFLRILFYDEYTPGSLVVRHLPKWQDNTLDDYLTVMKTRIQELHGIFYEEKEK